MFQTKKALSKRIEELERRLESAVCDIRDIRQELDAQAQRQTIFDKAFRAVGLWGDYVEFGTFRGDSFAAAYAVAVRLYSEMVSGVWDHALEGGACGRELFHRAWSEMRFIAFDSFEGIPETNGIDKILEVFKSGMYSCGEKEFLANIASRGVDLSKVTTVKGFFEKTLTPHTAEQLGLKRVAIVHIDSDLYESARLALEFVTPFLMDGSIVIFDEWYQFMGSPYRGERRAFLEWCQTHPEWVVSGFHKEGAFRNSFVLSSRLPEEIAEQPASLYG